MHLCFIHRCIFTIVNLKKVWYNPLIKYTAGESSMKKIFSVLLAFAIAFSLAIPGFAAKAVKFSMKAVSETDSEIVVSVNYDGGASFNCIDFEMTYNEKKLKVTEAYDGDGMEAFSRETKKEGGAVISAINKDSTPIKGSMATINPFKVTGGRDLFVVKFKKLSKDKVTADDIKIVFTNCADENKQNTVKPEVTNMLAAGSKQPATSASNAVTPTEKTSASQKDDKTTVVVSDPTSQKSETTVSSSEAETDVSQQTVTEKTGESEEDETLNVVSSETEKAQEKSSNTKKVIIIAAAAVCILFVAAAVCVYISKKSKKEEK